MIGHAALGDPVDGRHRRPRRSSRASRKAGALRGRRDRVARRRARRAVADRARHPDAPTARTRRCWPTRTSTRSTSRCRTTCTPMDDRRAPGRQARPVREAARDDRGRRASGWSTPRARRGRPPDGGVHVPPPPVVGGGRASSSPRGRIGRLTAVQSWFSYFNDDPANIRNIRRRRRRRAVRHRLLRGQPVADAVRRRADPSRRRRIARDPASGVDVADQRDPRFRATAIATFTCSTRTETDQRVDIYGTEGRISIEIPFNIPPDRPTRIFVTAGGDPPVAPATEVAEFPTADPYAVEAEPSPPPSSTARRRRCPPDGRRRQPAGHRARSSPPSADQGRALAVRRSSAGPGPSRPCRRSRRSCGPRGRRWARGCP